MDREIRLGDKMKYFINSDQYISGIVVEICEDNTVWLRHINGQERNYSVNTLVYADDE